MIRLIPATPGGLAFDPIASALTACAPVFRQLGGKKLIFEIGAHRGEYPIDGSYAVTIDPGTIDNLMLMDMVKIQVELLTADSSVDIDVYLYNDLTCVPAAVMSVDGATNGDFGRLALCYPEALHPAKSRSTVSYDVTKSGVVARGGRPFYGVVVTSISGNTIECHGPSCKAARGCYLGTVDTDVGPIDVYTHTEHKVVTDTVTTSIDEVMVPEVGAPFTGFFVDGDNNRVPIALTQAATMIDGRIVNYVDYLRALQIICVVEAGETGGRLAEELRALSMSNDDAVLLPVVRSGGRWYLDAAVTRLWTEYCAENQWVMSLFRRIGASDNEFFLQDDTGMRKGSISKNGNSQSCYALSYAYVIGLMFGGRLCDALAAIQTATDPGAGIRADGQFILANQSTWGTFAVRGADGTSKRVHKSGRGLATKSRQRGQSYNSDFTLDWLISTVGEQGVFILGYDPDVSKDANGYSDHFIVARVVNNRILVEFDPYRVEGSVTYAKYGTDVTAMTDSFHEACVHIFKEVIDDSE